MNRDALLNDIHTWRSQLETTLAEVDPKQVEEVVLHGDWSVKDLLGHLAFWEMCVQRLFHLLAEGKIPDGVGDQTGLDALNRKAYETSHNRPVAEVKKDEQEAFQSLLRLVEAAGEAELFDPAHFPWTEGRPFAELILDNSAGHYAEHLPELQAWLEQKN